MRRSEKVVILYELSMRTGRPDPPRSFGIGPADHDPPLGLVSDGHRLSLRRQGEAARPGAGGDRAVEERRDQRAVAVGADGPQLLALETDEADVVGSAVPHDLRPEVARAGAGEGD